MSATFLGPMAFVADSAAMGRAWTLEESLAAFEKGVGLVKALQSRLDEVQARVDQLTTAADGSVQVTPLASARPRSSAAWEEDADDPEDGGDE